MSPDQETSCSHNSSMGASGSKSKASEGLKPLTNYYEKQDILRAMDIAQDTCWETPDVLLHAIDVGLREFEKFGISHSKLRQDIRDDDLVEYKRFLVDLLGDKKDFQDHDLEDLEQAYEILYGEEIREKVGRETSDIHE